MLDKQGYMHERSRTRPRAWVHHKHVIFIAFPRQERFANAPHCHVIRTLSVLSMHVRKM